MSTAEANELADVMERVNTWPTTLRIALAHRILDSLGAPEASTTRPKKRGLSAAEVQGLLRTDRPAPDDETVKQWIDEHRMEKYG